LSAFTRLGDAEPLALHVAVLVKTRGLITRNPITSVALPGERRDPLASESRHLMMPMPSIVTTCMRLGYKP